MTEQIVWIVSASGACPHKAAGQEFFLDEEEATAKAEELTQKLKTVDCSPKYTAHRMIIREFPVEEIPGNAREQIRTHLEPRFGEICQERQALLVRKLDTEQEFSLEDSLRLAYLEHLIDILNDARMGNHLDNRLYALHIREKVAKMMVECAAKAEEE